MVATFSCKRLARPALLTAAAGAMAGASWLASRGDLRDLSHPSASAGWTPVFDEPFDDEVLGHATDVIEMHSHYEVGGRARSMGEDRKVADLSEGLHDYAIDWSPEAIVWYLDGKELWRVEDPAAISRELMHLVINLAVGGDWPGPPDRNTSLPARFEIDYARIRQRTQR